MIVTFCGHRDFNKQDELQPTLLNILEEVVGDEPVEFFLGGYGRFDSFARVCAEHYKKAHGNAKLVFVTPYMPNPKNAESFEICKMLYDEILYPDLESVPQKWAISYRNKYMIDRADCVIAFIDHRWGGAYTTYKRAISKKKKVINLFSGEL